MLLPAGFEVFDFDNPATKIKMKTSNKPIVLLFLCKYANTIRRNLDEDSA